MFNIVLVSATSPSSIESLRNPESPERIFANPEVVLDCPYQRRKKILVKIS